MFVLVQIEFEHPVYVLEYPKWYFAQWSLGTWICVKYFISFPHKNLSLRQTKCLLFNFSMLKLTKAPIWPNCQEPNGFFWCICKFCHWKIPSGGHWKIKNETLSLSQFSLVRGFLREWEEIFYKYSEPKTPFSFLFLSTFSNPAAQTISM